MSVTNQDFENQAQELRATANALQGANGVGNITAVQDTVTKLRAQADAMTARAGSASTKPTVPAPTYQPNGWDRYSSVVGGKRSQCLAQLVQETADAGAPEIAAHLPTYVVGAFWAKPDSGTSILVADPERYVVPTPAQEAAFNMSPAQVTQVLNNLHLLNDWEVSQFLAQQNYESHPQDSYHGEKGRAGFPVYVPKLLPSFGPDGGLVMRMLTPTEAALGWQFYHASTTVESPSWSGQSSIQRETFLGDHFVADRWFDLQTDEAVANYFRSWVHSFGVNVAPAD
jgi:hypothetical protein